MNNTYLTGFILWATIFVVIDLLYNKPVGWTKSMERQFETMYKDNLAKP